LINIFIEINKINNYLVGASIVGNNHLDRYQKIRLNERYERGILTINLAREDPSTPIPFKNVSENTL
jgi:hypothetical protein